MTHNNCNNFCLLSFASSIRVLMTIIRTISMCVPIEHHTAGALLIELFISN